MWILTYYLNSYFIVYQDFTIRQRDKIISSNLPIHVALQVWLIIFDDVKSYVLCIGKFPLKSRRRWRAKSIISRTWHWKEDASKRDATIETSVQTPKRQMKVGHFERECRPDLPTPQNAYDAHILPPRGTLWQFSRNLSLKKEAIT